MVQRIIFILTKKLFQKYLQVTKMKSERTNLGNLIEAIEVNYFLELTLGKLFGPTKVVPEIFRRGN